MNERITIFEVTWKDGRTSGLYWTAARWKLWIVECIAVAAFVYWWVTK